jgi:hypothetical protein
LERSTSPYFIRKPLLGSQARGIELFRRQDVVEYAQRIAHLEQSERSAQGALTLDLRGVPDLLATWVLRFDTSLLSELTLSKPVHCRRTKREHYGCMRTLALVKHDGASVDVRFLGGYWRLAAIPVDGDGMLWERFIGSQSQGAFCEPVAADDMRIVERFSRDVLSDYCTKLVSLPRTPQTYRAWETRYWLERYRQHVPALQDDRLWAAFLAEMDAAAEEAKQIKQSALAAGFLHTPAAYLTADQVTRTRLPYLVKQPQRIVAR